MLMFVMAFSGLELRDRTFEHFTVSDKSCGTGGYVNLKWLKIKTDTLALVIEHSY